MPSIVNPSSSVRGQSDLGKFSRLPIFYDVNHHVDWDGEGARINDANPYRLAG